MGVANLGHAGHASNKQHFVDVAWGDASVLHAVPAGLLGAVQQVAHQALKPAPHPLASVSRHISAMKQSWRAAEASS